VIHTGPGKADIYKFQGSEIKVGLAENLVFFRRDMGRPASSYSELYEYLRMAR